MKYRKKPIVVDAVQWTGDPRQGKALEMSTAGKVRRFFDDTLLIDTREGTMRADKWDWIITGIAGEMYPCKPDIFEASYEAVTA